MKKWKRFLPAGLLTLVLAAAAMLTFHVRAEERDDGTIPGRVYFGTVAVGGMTEEEAMEAMEAYVAQLSETKVIFRAGEHQLEATVGELGLSWDNTDIVKEAVALGKSGNLIARYMAMKDLEHEDKVYNVALSVDTARITGLLEENKETLNTEAVDGALTREDGNFVITPGIQGVNVDIAASVKTIEDYFNNGWDLKEAQVELVAEVVEPRGTQEELSKVKDVLGSYNTNFSDSSSGRVTNLQVGASKVNGKLLYPGEQFSVYEACSPFDAANGYRLAGAYENGTTVESYGGGMCQVSTTLYNAVIRAELEVVERFPHSMTVSYVDPSADAAIAGTYKDLKFVNNTDAPIYIEGYTSGRDIYFTIFGHETRPENRKVSFVSETMSSTDPGAEFKAVNAPIGSIKKVQSAHVGKSARLWKIVTVDGVEESREIFTTSNYSPSPAIYEVGIATSYPGQGATEAMQAAIATQDEATIRATADGWNDEAMAAWLAEQQGPGTPAQDPGQNPPTPINPDPPETPPEPDTGTPGDDETTQ